MTYAYDVIGDVHGHYDQLDDLLGEMDYYFIEEKNVFVHKSSGKAKRMPLFIGDYIDRGPDNIKVVELVRSMVQQGYAKAIMGNHDFNAVQWATPNPDQPGEFMRKHNENNLKQHKEFLDQVVENSDIHKKAIAWFKTLPIYIREGHQIFVHACWSPSAIKKLEDGGCITPDGVLTEKGWIEGANKKSPYYPAIDLLLKGPEEPLPDNMAIIDAQGKARSESRIAWWNENPATLADAYTSIPKTSVEEFRSVAYDPSRVSSTGLDLRAELNKIFVEEPDTQIFIGHIWETGFPKPLTQHVCCTDYSVAKGGILAAYRVPENSRAPLSTSNFKWIETEAFALKRPPNAPKFG